VSYLTVDGYLTNTDAKLSWRRGTARRSVSTVEILSMIHICMREIAFVKVCTIVGE